MLLSAHKSLKVSAYIHITQSKHLLNIKGNLRPGSLCDLPTNSVAHLCLIVCEIEMIFCRADCSLIFCRALQWSLQWGADVALRRFELVIDPRWTRCKFPVWWYRPICHVWVQSTSTLYLPRCHVAGSCVVAITQIMHFVAPVNSQCNPGELVANFSKGISTYLSCVASVCFDFYTCHVTTLQRCRPVLWQ